MQTTSCTWPYVVTIGEDPAAHGHWCAFTDLYHAMPCHATWLPPCHAMPCLAATSNSSFTIALSLLCAFPHLHVRATTREAARPQPQGSEDATGYWAADSLLPPPLSPFFPFPLHLLCLLVNLMGFPLKPAPMYYPVQWDGLSSGYAVVLSSATETVCSHAPMCNAGFLGRWGMHACPQCLPSDIVPIRSWTRTLRRPGVRHRHLPCHAMPCQASVTDIYHGHATPCHARCAREGKKIYRCGPGLDFFKSLIKSSLSAKTGLKPST